MKFVALGSLVLLVLVATVRKRWDRPIVQYLFFCRVPIVCGLLLALLPIIAHVLAPTLLASMFVLDHALEVLMVVAIAVVTGYMVVQTCELILQRAPERMEVRPLLPGNRLKSGYPLSLPPIWARIGSVVLALPLSLAVTWRSWSVLSWSAFWMFCAGVVLGLTLIGIARHLRNKLRQLMLQAVKKTTVNLQQKTRGIIKKVPALPNIFKGYNSPGSAPGGLVRSAGHVPKTLRARMRSHVQVAVPTLFLMTVFFSGAVLMRPPHVPIPALFFVVYLILILGYVLSAVTFFLDRFRFPILVFLIWGTILLSFFSSGSRHYYMLEPYAGEPAAPIAERQQSQKMVPAAAQEEKPQDRASVLRGALQDALQKRLEKQGQEKVLVAFATSGGGIQAAAWTAQVLTGLHADDTFGPAFLDAVNMISSVSGGTIGSLFLLDRLKLLQETSLEAERARIREAIRNNAMANSLPAVAWSLAYQDAFRFSGANWFVDRKGGRGWALEETFRERMLEQHQTATLRGHWQTAVEAGDIPLPVFNSTLVESGDRFLISPLVLPVARRAQSFHDVYPDFDINLATAARLSATFPYVSPLVSPWSDTVGAVKPGWHVVDGGYFDNYGIFSLIEWLNAVVMPVAESFGIARILIVQINAFPLESAPERYVGAGTSAAMNQKKLGAWEAAVIGPVKALNKVRVSTQKARNTTELDLLRAAWRHVNVKICEFDIRYLLPGDPDAQPDPPVSWKLSSVEKENIAKAWAFWQNSRDYQQLRDAWLGTCPCSACKDDLTEKIKATVRQKKASAIGAEEAVEQEP